MSDTTSGARFGDEFVAAVSDGAYTFVVADFADTGAPGTRMSP